MIEVFIRDALAVGGGYWSTHSRFTSIEEAEKYGWTAR